MTQVFISYSKEDSVFAQLAQAKLEATGMNIWLFEGALHPGENWRDAIDDGIVSSDALIVILSPESSASSYVTYEWAYALGKGTKVIPVLLKETKIHPRLEPLQYLDFTGRQMDWTKLIEEIKQRSLDVHQEKYQVAEAINNLAINAYIDRLTLQFRTVRITGFGSLMPGFQDPGASFRTCNAFGESVQYDLNKQGSEAESELRSVVNRVVILRTRKGKSTKDTLLRLFREVQDPVEFIGNQLGKIPYGSKTLAESWNVAQEQVRKLWEDKSKEIMYFNQGDIDRLQKFLEEHPAYQQVYETEKQAIDTFLQPGTLTIEELIDLTRSELYKSLKESIS